MEERYGAGVHRNPVRAVYLSAARMMILRTVLLRCAKGMLACMAIAVVVSMSGLVSDVAYAQNFSDRGVSGTAQGNITPQGVYTVMKGDSLYGISRRFGISVDQVASLNGLSGSQIFVGQKVKISAEVPTHASAVTTAKRNADIDSSTPIIHIVKRGDTAYRIARDNGISLKTLDSFNNMNGNYLITVGQKLIVGNQSEGSTSPEASQLLAKPVDLTVKAEMNARKQSNNSVESIQASGESVRSNGSYSQENQSKPNAKVEEKADWTKNIPLTNANHSGERTVIELSRRRLENLEQPTRQEETIYLPSSRNASEGDPKFIWPVRGRLLSNFGPREGGLVNDGINISVRTGEAVRAVANGKVLYASNEMQAFGNLVLLQHADGWVTAYAHNDRLRVKEGDRVKQGDIIASAGSTGTVDRSQLHFEIRQNGKPVNPMNVLNF